MFAEIISADSRQVYKGLDIGTGKITEPEMRGIPHHLLNVANPRDTFSVADFQTLGTAAITNMLSQGHTPIITGGTGLYISALLENQTLPNVPPNESLRTALETESAITLFAQLQERDPERAKTIDPHNKRRLIRALEIVAAIGAVPPINNLSANTKKTDKEHPYNVLWIGLDLPKDRLQHKIRERIDIMIKQGLIAEVEQLLDPAGEYQLTHERLQSLGLEYRHVSLYLLGHYGDPHNPASVEAMCADLATKTWQYAKRQMTWFKRNTAIHWFNPETDTKKILQLVNNFLQD